MREKRQVRTLHRHIGTTVFFHRRPWLARTRPGRRALRVAHVWIVVVRRELAETRSSLERLLDPVSAIRLVFGVYGSQAVAVSSCETGGTFSIWARNGQYEGLFQMGSRERARYGHGATAIAQARAAWRYFDASGRDWSPWECKP